MANLKYSNQCKIHLDNQPAVHHPNYNLDSLFSQALFTYLYYNSEIRPVVNDLFKRLHRSRMQRIMLQFIRVLPELWSGFQAVFTLLL